MIAKSKPWGTVLPAKVLLALVVIGALFPHQFKDAYPRRPPGGKSSLGSAFVTWDAANYVMLSDHGYQAGSSSCAFYPLWPLVLRVGTVITGGRPALAAMLLANALSLVGLWMLYRLVERHCETAISRDTLILLLAFPGALFFSFPYTESLYLMLLMALFWGLEREQWWWTGLAGFLLPLARPVGVFILLPLAWHIYERGHAEAGSDQSRAGCVPVSMNRRPRWQWLLLVCPLLGYATYFGVMYAWTGNAFEGFEAQKSYPNSPSIKNMFDVAGFTRALLNVGSFDGMMDSVLDRGFFLLFLALLPLTWRLDRTWFFYVLPAGLVPALSSWFMSYRRYTTVLFPLFIVLAQLLAKTRRRWLFWYYVVLMAALQVWAVAQFVNFNWAG